MEDKNGYIKIKDVYKSFVTWRVFAWAVTIITLILGWGLYVNVAMSSRIQSNSTEGSKIQTQLSQIQTDLQWIKQTLQNK